MLGFGDEVELGDLPGFDHGGLIFGGWYGCVAPVLGVANGIGELPGWIIQFGDLDSM